MSAHEAAGREIATLAALLDRHVTDSAFESGCRLSCGYDGNDLTEHMAAAILASDWMKAHDAEVAAAALREAAETPAAMRVNTDGNATGREWLLYRADEGDPR